MDPTLEVARSAWTDFAGSFLFEDLTGNEYRIRVDPIDGFAPAETTARVGVTSANLVLVWLREFRVYGTVSSTEGTPLEDVRVLAGPPTRVTNTGPEGDYELDISIKGKNQHTIRFQRDGYRDHSERLEPADLEGMLGDFQLDVSMEPLGQLTSVTGRLEDTDKHPVAGKILSLRSSALNTSYSAQSDLDGQFSMEEVEPGKGYKLSVQPGADYRDFERAQLEIPDTGLKLIVVLEPLGRGGLSGWMTDVDGNRVPGFAMTLHSRAVTGQSLQVVSDYTGFFMVENFPEGDAVLKTNSYPIFETQGISSSDEAEDPVQVILDIGPHAIQGKVTNVFGDAIAASEVSLGWQHSANGVQNYSARKTTADQNGNFAFTGLGPGLHTLRINAQGFSMAVINVEAGLNSDNIVVELTEES